jgi:hypothetical protein
VHHSNGLVRIIFLNAITDFWNPAVRNDCFKCLNSLATHSLIQEFIDIGIVDKAISLAPTELPAITILINMARTPNAAQLAYLIGKEVFQCIVRRIEYVNDQFRRTFVDVMGWQLQVHRHEAIYTDLVAVLTAEGGLARLRNFDDPQMTHLLALLPDN